MGNTQQIIETIDTQASLDRRNSFENQFEEVEDAPDYEEIIVQLHISWMPRFLKQILSSFLNTPFAGGSESIYMKRAESHMQINAQHSINDQDFKLEVQYLKLFREVWYRFDPYHTGTILFNDVIALINCLHEETRCPTWETNPSEYENIRQSFPNTVITYLEFCLWAEYGECYSSYHNNNTEEFVRSATPDPLKWVDNERMYRTCFTHGELYTDNYDEAIVLEQLLCVFTESSDRFLTVEQIRAHIEKQKHFKKNSLVDETLNELARRVEFRINRLVVTPETMDHPEMLCMYDMALNLFRPLVFIPTRRCINKRENTKQN